MTALKPREADGGPKRTSPHMGDAWQKHASCIVEEGVIGVAVIFFFCRYPPISDLTACFLFCPRIKADRFKKRVVILREMGGYQQPRKHVGAKEAPEGVERRVPIALNVFLVVKLNEISYNTIFFWAVLWVRPCGDL